jgi:asparagine synthetase B (glutamine-hydrolysing)
VRAKGGIYLFLIAITRSEIASNFQYYNLEVSKRDSSIITVVTDNFLSKLISEPDGFSIIESPIISNENLGSIVLSQVKFNDVDSVLEISRSTLSGRAIYYQIDSKGNLFCSTHISMLRKAGVKIEENPSVLPEFFVYRYVMPPQTLYKNVMQLVGGSRLQIKLFNGKCKVASASQFMLPKEKKELKSVKNISKQVADYLTKCIQPLSPCRDRLVVLLSGGLDSSILFKTCQTTLGIDTTCSTGYPFEDPRNNVEKEYALSAAEALQAKHEYYEPTNSEYLRGFVEAVSAAEEPIHHLQSVVIYLLFKKGLARSKNIVVSGFGADGCWGWTLLEAMHLSSRKLFKLLLSPPMVRLFRFASKVTRRGGLFIDTSVKWKVSQNCSLQDPNHIIWDSYKYGSEDWVCENLNVSRHDIIKDRYNAIKSMEGRSIYDVISFYDFLSETSVSHSIWSKLGESQHKILLNPYTYSDLLSYSYTVPWDLKLRTHKSILRWTARQYGIPEFIISRPKSGFNIRAKGWAERGGIFDSLIPLASKVFDENQIRNLQSSNLEKAMTFWNILNYSIWKRLCINNESADVLLEELDQ